MRFREGHKGELMKDKAVPVLAVLMLATAGGFTAEDPRYYAHPVVEDAHGVIAPWYKGRNGQLDARLRMAVELYKRYPWVKADQAVQAAPHIIYNTHWRIAEDGTITIPPTHPWMCGDLSQRALSIIQGLTAYYRYSGDPLAFIYIPLTVDYVLDWCLTGPGHPWPSFPIATPTKGIGYRRADPAVPNQLDLCAYLGVEVIRAYKLTGTRRYLDAAKQWGEVFARKCNFKEPALPPWNRYMSPQYKMWSDELTGGVVLIAEFLDELIALGHEGPEGVIVKARDAARAYVKDNLLPRWTENEVWGRHYWDMEGDLTCGVVPWICEYFMHHRDAFPNWRTDVRNILTLPFNRNSVDPASRGGVYSGAWAIPESSICCGTSLSYNQYTYAPAFMIYGRMADDPWAEEIGRRMMLMATYDSLATGVVFDGIDGRVVAAGEWLNLAHPWPLCQIMKAMAVMPGLWGPTGENHIMDSTSVVTDVVYDKGNISYSTFAAPPGVTETVRLAFDPEIIEAGGKKLERRDDLSRNGYTVISAAGSQIPGHTQLIGTSNTPEAGGDVLVHIRHDGDRTVVIRGNDPQTVVEDSRLIYDDAWKTISNAADRGGGMHAAETAGARMQFTFTGNQVRVIGAANPAGGRADVFIDGARQRTCIDCWLPVARHRQVLYSQSGLKDGRHTLAVVARGEGTPLARGAKVFIDAIQYSAAAGNAPFGSGGGSRSSQRMIFGYTGRGDYVDSRGNMWRPGMEFVARPGRGVDSVEHALYTNRRCITIGNTDDPELYRYGIHGKEFHVQLTVGPGRYSVRLLFADTDTPGMFKVLMNGEEAIEAIRVRDAAGGLFRAFDLVFPDVRPVHGMIGLHFLGLKNSEACLQALEVAPYEGAACRARYRAARQLLHNHDFEKELDRIPTNWDLVHKAPGRWEFAAKSGIPDHGFQNITPIGKGKVGAWISAGDHIRQTAAARPVEKGARYRVAARVLGKGRQDAAASTAVGNRIGVTVFRMRNPDSPFKGKEGVEWGVVASASTIVQADMQWMDIKTTWKAASEQADRILAVKGWYRQEKGTADSYGYFDEISLTREGGMLIEKRESSP